MGRRLCSALNGPIMVRNAKIRQNPPRQLEQLVLGRAQLELAPCVICFALLSALTYMVIPACALVATLPSTRPSLLSSCARVTFFIVTSGITVRKRERPPRPRDKEES